MVLPLLLTISCNLPPDTLGATLPTGSKEEFCTHYFNSISHQCNNTVIAYSELWKVYSDI